MKTLLSRFIERDVVDPKSFLTKPFDMSSYESILSKNSNQDFQVVNFIWTNYGLCSFKKGLFWTVNPAEYSDVVKLFKNVSNNAIPLIRTATGSFVLWDFFDEEWVIMYLDVHLNNCEFYADKLSDLFNYDLISDPVWIDDLNGEREFMALECYPEYKHDECIVPIPALVAGGEFLPEHLQKVKLLEHLYLLAQFHNKL